MNKKTPVWKVVICDDQAVVREGLEAILSTAKNLQVVALASNGKQALELVATHRPHVVLMDLNMPVMNGVQATKGILKQFPETFVLVLTTYAKDEWVFDAIRAGATGYLLKDIRGKDLIHSIEETAQGRNQLHPEIAGKVMAHIAQENAPPFQTNLLGHPPLPEALTYREKEILKLLSQGLSNPQIGKELKLSSGTIRNYISVILSKLNATDRTQAAVIALKSGIL